MSERQLVEISTEEAQREYVVTGLKLQEVVEQIDALQAQLDTWQNLAEVGKAKLQAAEKECAALRKENHEAHAMLTGKFEIGWVMSHPDGVPETELGKAAMERNKEVGTLRAQNARLRDALGQYANSLRWTKINYGYLQATEFIAGGKDGWEIAKQALADTAPSEEVKA